MMTRRMKRLRTRKLAQLFSLVLIALLLPMLSCYEVETSESAPNNLPENSSGVPLSAASLDQAVVSGPTVITVPVSLPLPEREDLKRGRSRPVGERDLPTGRSGL